MQAFVSAVNSGCENVKEVLLSPESKLQLVPLGPQLVKQTVNKHTTIDTEDIELKCKLKPDGTLVTEKKKTTEHEDILDRDLPDDENQSLDCREKILTQKVSETSETLTDIFSNVTYGTTFNIISMIFSYRNHRSTF